jgi:DNA polymerase-1
METNDELKTLLSFIKMLKEFESINSKILKPVQEWCGRDGRVHSSYNLGTTRTGRLSSSGPNLQNISAKETILKTVEGAPIIRNIFRAIPGHVLLEVDIAQAELRILAHLSQDPTLLKIFREGKIDIHDNTARNIFGDVEISVDMRRVAKTVNFGIAYGATQYRVAAEAGVSPEIAQSYIDSFFRSYPGVLDWMNIIYEEGLSNGYVFSEMGRVRRFGPADFDDFKGKWKRQAINHPVQSLASDIVLFTTNKLAGYLKIVNTVHDSILFEIEEKKVEEVAQYIKQVVEIEVPKRLPFKLSIPWLCDLKIGTCWGSMTKLEVR